MPLITIPRTDADSSRWPEGYSDHELDIAGNPNYHEKINNDHQKYDLFMSKIGEHLATKQGLPDPRGYRLSGFPVGYSLFFHHKKQADGTDRKDIYLFGSVNVLKFRSPSEFFQHAEWLMNTSIPLEDTHFNTCTCKYAKNSAFQGAAAIASTSEGGASTKRKAATTSTANGTSSKRAKYTVDEKMVQFQKESANAMRERVSDLRGQHRYRRGEIVWLKLDSPIDRPESSTYDAKGKLSSIEWWPAIVSGHRLLKGEYEYDVSMPGKIVFEDGQGMKNQYFIKSENELLPLVAVPYGGLFNAVTAEVTEIAEAYKRDPSKFTSNQANGEDNKPSGWKSVFFKKMTITEARKNWDAAMVHYADALHFVKNVHGCFCQTDGYADQDTMAHMMEGDEDLDDLRREELSKNTTYFQGLWWGGERVWKDEFVRVIKARKTLPEKWPASPGALERGVFMRIDKIVYQDKSLPGGELDRHVQIAGDVFELAEEEWVRENEPETLKDAAAVNGATTNGDREEPTWETSLSFHAEPEALPKPPKGYVYRKLNGQFEEVTADIFDVAGRVYPGLDDHPAIAHVPAAKDRLRVLHGMCDSDPKLNALSSERKWIENRYSTMAQSHTEGIAELGRLFGEQVKPFSPIMT